MAETQDDHPMIDATPSARALCGAKTSNGGTCRHAPMPNGRCHLHGGKSLGGLASPTFKTGRSSRYLAALPERMREVFESVSEDADYLTRKSAIDAMEARVIDLLSRVDTGESGATWRSLHKTWEAGEKALGQWNLNSLQGISSSSEGGTPKQQQSAAEAKQTFFEAWEMIGVLCSEGQADYQAWDEVYRAEAAADKLVQTEIKRITAAQNSLTRDESQLLLFVLQQAIVRHVSDRRILAKIHADLAPVARAVVGGQARQNQLNQIEANSAG